MSSTHPSVHEMWNDYLASMGENPETTSKSYTAWHFCNNKTAADELAELMLKGDKTLDYWRKVHHEAFAQELNELGLEFSDDMPVLCETFEVVWPL